MKKQLLLFLSLFISLSLFSQEKKVIPLNHFSSDLFFHDGLLAVKNDEVGKWGFIDSLGNIAIPFEWELNHNPAFGGGACALFKRINNKIIWYILDKDGNSIALPEKFHKLSNFNKDGYAYAIIKNGGLYTLIYINSKGQQVFPALNFMSSKYHELNLAPPAFYDGLARFVNDGKIGYVNKKGEIIVPPILSRAHDFSEGLAGVYFSDNPNTPLRWGFINTKGEVAIPMIYSNEVGSFHNGLARIQKKNSQYVYINKNGEVVSQEYPAATRFFNGYAFVSKHKGGEASLLSENMQVIKLDGETFKGKYYSANSFHGEHNIIQYKGNYILIMTAASDTKLIDEFGNYAGFWDIAKICSDNIVVRGNPLQGRCVFYDIEKREPIFSIEESEF